MKADHIRNKNEGKKSLKDLLWILLAKWKKTFFKLNLSNVTWGSLTKSLYTSLQLPCFPLDYFSSIKYEFPIVWNQYFIPGPGMYQFCSYGHFIGFTYVTMETLAWCCWCGEPSDKHLSCPQEQLESVHCGCLTPRSLPVLSAAEKGPHGLPPSPPKISSHPSNRQTGTGSIQHREYLTGKVAAWMP
jgi:hypothetical protein